MATPRCNIGEIEAFEYIGSSAGWLFAGCKHRQVSAKTVAHEVLMSGGHLPARVSTPTSSFTN